ncbi:MAG TPA: J domain-containing protein [Candidatus Polarisedimenticolaceae bacterium]|nr:J domain-containing protein [Candidatus Polarisedimenticolaceae bacterium]
MGLPDGVVRDPLRALADAARARGSGILSATRGKQKRLICLVDGKLAFVATNVIEEQLEQFLVVKGTVKADRVQAIAREAKQAGQRTALMLLQRNVLGADQLYAAAAEHCKRLFESTLEWPGAGFLFSGGRPRLLGELTVDLPCLALLYDHARRFPKTMAEVRERIGPAETRPIRVEDGKTALDGVELDDSARGVLELCDGFLTAAEVVARVRGSAEAAWRAIHALMTVGALRAVAKGELPKTTVSQTVTRDEMLARLARDESDHYAVLGLTQKAAADEIRDAYYYLARRYHPDRHRTGELRDLMGRIEAFFTKVTEAYNTLYDPELRAKYDEEIAVAGSAGASVEPQQDTRYLAKQNFARGRLLSEKKQYHDALKFFENAIELDPSKAEYHLELGQVLSFNPRRRDDAERALRRAVEMNPGLTRAYGILGEMFERAERVEDAIEMFEELLRWESRNTNAAAALDRLTSGRRKRPSRS